MGVILMDVRALVVLVLAGCSVGAVQGGGGPDADIAAAEASFNAQIKPLVNRCLNCHSTTQPPNFTSFDTLLPKYYAKPGASNILVIKGSQGSPPGMHEGITYLDATEQTTVASWIDSL